MPIYKIEISDLLNLVNPLDGQMWKCGRIEIGLIKEARELKKNESRSWNTVVNIDITIEEQREFHISRIATLVDNVIDEPITLILENHIEPIKAYLNDGNHRLAAAFIRGDKNINVLVAASSNNPIKNVFPSSILISD